MPATFVALLRAVNVGGTSRLLMADLRAFFEAQRLDSVQTLLQSGNVVFSTDSRSTAKLESVLEFEAAKALGLETDFFVRSTKEWDAVVRENPFPKEAKSEPGKLLVSFLKRAPSAAAVRSLQSSIAGPERVRARGKQAYIVYPNGAARSKVTTRVVEKALGSTATARNWNTVLKLQEALG